MWIVRFVEIVAVLSVCWYLPIDADDYNPSRSRGGATSRGTAARGKQRSSFQEEEETGFRRGGATNKIRPQTRTRGGFDDGDEEGNYRGGARGGDNSNNSNNNNNIRGNGRGKAESFFQGGENLAQDGRGKNARGGTGKFARDDEDDQRLQQRTTSQARGRAAGFDQDERIGPSGGRAVNINFEESRPKVGKIDQGDISAQAVNFAKAGLPKAGPQPKAESAIPPVNPNAAKGASVQGPKGGGMGTASMVDTLFQTGNQKTCGVKPVMPKPVPATWVGSFPGSGAEVTWQLIQAITGLATDEDTSNIGHAAKGAAVAIKTHFPSLAPAGVFINLQKKLGVKQAILLIRNPMSAIPSYFNFQWEYENGLKPHTRRAPPHKWVEWRNGNFENELIRWSEHVRWWADSFQVNRPGRLHLLVFERLVNPDTGVDELVKLGRFFRNVAPEIAESMTPFKEYACVWQMLVQPPASIAGGRKRSDAKALRGPRKFPYTSQHLQLLNQHISALRTEYAQSFPEFSNLMQQYLTELETQFLFMNTAQE